MSSISGPWLHTIVSWGFNFGMNTVFSNGIHQHSNFSRRTKYGKSEKILFQSCSSFKLLLEICQLLQIFCYQVSEHFNCGLSSFCWISWSSKNMLFWIFRCFFFLFLCLFKWLFFNLSFVFQYLCTYLSPPFSTGFYYSWGF